MTFAGKADVERAARGLAARLPDPLAPLARIAYNYRWSWHDDGMRLFRDLDSDLMERVRDNPVRLLQEAPLESLERAAGDASFVERAEALDHVVREDVEAPFLGGPVDPARPVAFLCAEFGIHRSLPLYSGGLGVLAGDILKASSDLRIPLVGVGLMYVQGYFHQRLDPSGWQHDYWITSDPARFPGALVTGEDGTPITVSVPIRGRNVTVQIWRIDVGRVPLYSLDANRPENDVVDQWITSRLYTGDRGTRLAQYALLGMGGVRALRALGIDPGVVHLNEGHASLAALELARQEVGGGRSFAEAVASARSRTVFTTHTPVAAGNETFAPADMLKVMGSLPRDLKVDSSDVLALGRSDDIGEIGVTVLGLRLSRAANGVSARHGHVARTMWSPLYPHLAVDDVPIGHVTNGVHVPTWVAPPIRDLLRRHLGDRWLEHPSDPDAWAGVASIPDEEVWEVRNRLRRDFVTWLRDRATADRLAREEPAAYVRAGATAFDPNALTVGFARRVAAYKRLTLLINDPDRVMALLAANPEPVQVVLAGKAHPRDEDAKRKLQALFELKWAPEVATRVAYLEDYDIGAATQMVWGCDIWVNLPRPPLEASGTSGMKSALNGGLNVSVLDGWWEEAWTPDDPNGWGIISDAAADYELQDRRDAMAFYDAIEKEVLPTFYDRDAHGIPRAWIQRVKRSLMTNGPRFSATRMMEDYLRTTYSG